MRLDSEPSLTVGLMHQQHYFQDITSGNLRRDDYGVFEWPKCNVTSSLRLHSTQHCADADNNQINDGHYYGDLDQGNGQTNKKSNDPKRHARRRQHQWNTDCQYKQRQQDNSDYSQNICCLFHFLIL